MSTNGNSNIYQNPAILFLLIVLVVIFYIRDSINTHREQPWRKSHCHVSDINLKKQVDKFNSVNGKWSKLWEEATFEGDYTKMAPSTDIYKKMNSSSRFLLKNVNCFVKNYNDNLHETVDLWGGGSGFIRSVETAIGILEDVDFNTK